MKKIKKKDPPEIVVWELTNECNFNCKHCYNSSNNVKKYEFDLDKGLQICNELASLNASNILLSGGEVLLSKIWKPVAIRLIELGMRPGLLSNGWFFTKETIKEIKSIGIDWIAFSIDGLQQTHDKNRKEDSFERIMNALDLLKNENSLFVSTNTTVLKNNINDLPELLKIMNEKEVYAWQVQLGLTQGNLFKNKESLMLSPEDIDRVIDFIYDHYKTSKTELVLGDCIGHYNKKEIEIRSASTIEEFGCYNFVNGCQAGIETIGIKANGDITGCISLCDKFYVEGNIYKRYLSDIWNNENSFLWNRSFDTSQMKGICSSCIYGEYCRSGCPALYFDEKFNIIENRYCSYNVAIRKKITEIQKEINLEKLIKEKKEAQEYNNNYLIEKIDSRIKIISKN